MKFECQLAKKSLKNSFCNEKISINSMVFIHDIKDYFQENMLMTMSLRPFTLKVL